jgi:hypothetical protein
MDADISDGHREHSGGTVRSRRPQRCRHDGSWRIAHHHLLTRAPCKAPENESLESLVDRDSDMIQFFSVEERDQKGLKSFFKGSDQKAGSSELRRRFEEP